MSTNQSRLWGKTCTISLDLAPQYLRKVFKEEWDSLNPATPWDDHSNTALDQFILQEKNDINNWKQRKKYYSRLSPHRKDWDATGLFQVLLYSRSLDLEQRKPGLYGYICEIKKVRNDLVHRPNTTMGKGEFERQFDSIEKAFSSIKIPSAVDDLKEIKKDAIRPTVAELEDAKKRWKDEQDNKVFLVILYVAVAVLITFAVFYKLNTPNRSSQTQIDAANTNRAIITVVSIAVVAIIACSVCNVHLTVTQNGPDDFPKSKCPSFFYGRQKDITMILNSFKEKTHRMVNIYGSLGIGKTATSIAVGNTAREYGFRVAYADLQGQVTIPGICERILASLGMQPIDSFNPHHFETMLRQNVHQNTLIILDNIDKTEVLSMEQGEGFIELISFHILRVNFISILTTSRSKLNISNVSVMNVYLDSLPISDCVKILLHINPQIDESHAEALAALTGGNPLLVELSGRYLENGFADAEELIGKIEEMGVVIDSESKDEQIIKFKHLTEDKHSVS